MMHRSFLCAAILLCAALLLACGPATPKPDPPSPSPSAARSAPEPANDQAHIREVVRARFDEFRACYEKGLAHNPDLTGKVMVHFSIAEDGSVRHASAGGDIADADVTSCVVDVFETLKFTPPGAGEVTVSYPIIFSPTKPPAPSGSEKSGRLDPKVIQKRMRDNFGEFRKCYEKGLAKDPHLTGRIMLRFVIDHDGRIKGTPEGDFPDAAVQDCVKAKLTNITFPKPEGGRVTVSYPIVFSPSAK